MSFFEIGELAERIGCNRRRLVDNIVSKGCAHVHVGTLIFLREESFDNWLKEREEVISGDEEDKDD